MKQIKILGVLAIALTLGLTACGGGKSTPGGNSNASTPSGTSAPTSKHEHTFDTTKWEHNDTNHWHPATCEHTSQKGDNAKHTFGDPYDVVAPTCTEAGSQKVKCTVCEAEVTQTIPAAGHTWGEWETVTGATCTEAGSRKHKCTVCEVEETETVDALGHDWGEWEVLEAATCDKAGKQKHTCARCSVVEEEAIPALGHNMQLIGDDTEPEPGKAKVRVYTCANECGTTYLGFKANEVSEESKGHLSFTETQTADGKTEVGASFWGRPIGNALALDASGTSVAQQVDECVYCSTETGDFFEYIFDLTAEQVEQAGLDNCRLYLDAKPANYMNGGDFFAYGGGNTDDWTPGYYIDGSADHIETDAEGQPVMVKDHARSVRAEDGSEAEGVELETEVPMGKRITDYRYVLYVDDVVQAFEQGVSNPTRGSNTNMTRQEFILPFVFKLHAGTNKIRLGMAGGYRSTFYNFTFRPVEEQQGGEEQPHVHQYADAKAGTIETEGCTPVDVFNCTENDASVLRWEAKAYDATLSNEIEAAATDGSIRFNRAQGKNGEDDKGGHLVYKINSPVAVEKAGLDFYIQAHNQNVAIFDAVSNDSGAGKDVDAEGKYTVAPTKRYALYVNDVRVELGEDPGKSTAKAWFTWPVEFPLQKGENKIEIVSLGGYRAKMYNFQLTGLPKISVPVKTWSWEEITAGKSDSGWASDKDFGEAGKAFKFNKENGSVTLNYESATAQKVMLQLKIAVKQSNNALTGFWKQSGTEKTRISLNDTALTAPETEPDFTGSVASSVNDSGIISVPEWYDIIELDLVAGANKIEVKFLTGGYSYYFGGAQLVK